MKRIGIQIVLVILITAQATPNAGSQNSEVTEGDGICHTETCKNASTTLQDYMNRSVNPCDNFYQFACGGFLDEKVIPESESSVNVFSDISRVLFERLKGVVENGIDDSSPRSFKLLKDYYDLCMDTDLIEKTSSGELRKVLDYIGGWPVLSDSWDESNFDLKNFTYKLRKLGYPVDSFIGFSIEVDQKNNTKHIIRLTQPLLIQSRTILLRGLNESNVQAYLNYSIAFAEILGASYEKARAELEESLKFEIKLANISLSDRELLNVSANFHLMKLQELERKFPIFPWREYLNELLSPYTSLRSDEIIWVQTPKYLKGLFKLLNKTSKHVLANYAVWRVVEKSSIAMGEKAQDAVADYNRATLDIQTKEKRWKSCIEYCNYWDSSFKIATGALYVRNFFDKSSKKKVSEIVNDVRASFREIINETQWMDEKTKQEALEKLNWIDAIIGYPKELLDDLKLDGYYKDMNLETSNFFNSQLSTWRFQYDRNIKSLREKNIRGDWRDHGNGAIVNAFYNPNDNSIEITAGMLEGHLFVKNRPKYMNYGTVGWVVGHELTHGFDTSGSQYDKRGNLRDWWDPQTEKKYQNRTTYIIDEYNKESIEFMIGNTLENFTINGENTVGENIADNGGIKEAYGAYTKYEGRNGVEDKLPDLPYNPRQLFWISAATVFCDKETGEALREQIFDSEHAPSEIRVIGTFSNIPEFSEDFNCPEGSNMNPKEKYSVW